MLIACTSRADTPLRVYDFATSAQTGNDCSWDTTGANNWRNETGSAWNGQDSILFWTWPNDINVTYNYHCVEIRHLGVGVGGYYNVKQIGGPYTITDGAGIKVQYRGNLLEGTNLQHHLRVGVNNSYTVTTLFNTTDNGGTWTAQLNADQIKKMLGVTSYNQLVLYFGQQQTYTTERYAIRNMTIYQYDVPVNRYNVTMYLHSFNGNYTTSPLIAGTVTYNDTEYTVGIEGSVHNIAEGYYDIVASSVGHDNATTTRTFTADTTVDLYLLKQNNSVVNYDVVDSITSALVPTPDIEFYDTVTGIRVNTTSNKGLMPVICDHLYYVNGSKTGYTSFSQSYTFTGDTQISVVLGSTLSAPEGKAYVTVKAWHSAHGEAGVNVHLDGKVQTTDESGLTTFLVNDSATYGWTADKVGFYPTYGTQAVNGYARFDVIMTPRTGATATPSPGEVDTTIIDGYKGLVDGAVDGVTDAITGAIDVLVSPVGLLNNSVTSVRTSVQDGMGFAGNSTNVYTDLFGVLIFGLPWQVKGLITYFLAWVLVLMFLNR